MLEEEQIQMILKSVGIIVLGVIILFILVWTGLMKCGTVPFLCDGYEAIMGAPRVLIVYGDEGLGDPQALKLLMQDPATLGVNAVDLANVDQVSLGNLKSYKLVIVEHARKMSIDQLKMFTSYVNQYGGRLVWIGDAGTVKGDDELTDFTDINALAKVADNPWVRVKETDTDYIVENFDEFLGLRFKGNYCDISRCNDGNFTVGNFKTESTGNHPLIFGAAPIFPIKINKERQISVVQQFANAANSNVVVTLEQSSLGKSAPVVVTSGMGERIAYYAYPLEYMALDNASFVYLKRMYLGMLGK